MTQKTDFQTHIDHAAIDAAYTAFIELVEPASHSPRAVSEEEALAQRRARERSYANCLEDARRADSGHAEDRWRALLHLASCEPANDAQGALLLLAMVWNDVSGFHLDGSLDSAVPEDIRRLMRCLWAVRDFLVTLGADASTPSVSDLMGGAFAPGRRVAAAEQSFAEDGA